MIWLGQGSQLPSAAPFFPSFWEGFPLNSTNQEKDSLFSHGHWASENLVGFGKVLG